jgi:hypothetical protein
LLTDLTDTSMELIEREQLLMYVEKRLLLATLIAKVSINKLT